MPTVQYRSDLSIPILPSQHCTIHRRIHHRWSRYTTTDESGLIVSLPKSSRCDSSPSETLRHSPPSAHLEHSRPLPWPSGSSNVASSVPRCDSTLQRVNPVFISKWVWRSDSSLLVWSLFRELGDPSGLRTLLPTGMGGSFKHVLQSKWQICL